MTEFYALRAKAYAYKLNDDTEMKKAKGTKKCIVKRELMFENYVDALFNDEVIIRSQQRFRSDHHKVYTEDVNKIALSSNDDKRTQTFDKVTTFPYGTNVYTVCESKMLLKNKLIVHDEDINISKNEDIDISKTGDNINTTIKTKTKTEDNDKDRATIKTKADTEDKDEDTDKDMLIRVFKYSKQWKGKKKVVGKGKSSGSFGVMVINQNYVKSGYALMISMHTQGLKSFAHILARWFLLENVRQPYQKINQTPT